MLRDRQELVKRISEDIMRKAIMSKKEEMKVDSDTLDSMREQYGRLSLAEAKLNAERSSLDLDITKEMVKRGLTSKTHALCLNCGAIYPMNKPHECES